MLCVFDSKKEYVTSIEDLSRELQKSGVFIRKQSLQERFNSQASCFMKKMVEYALSKKLTLSKSKIKCQFGRIIINDSTFFQLPEAYSNRYKGSGGHASKSGIKNQFCYDLLSHEIIDITLEQAAVPDSKYPLQDLQKNDLRIEDLGYFRVDKFRHVQNSKAYFLSRLRFRVNIYRLENGSYRQLDLLKLIGKMKEGEIKSIDVRIGEKEKFVTRLVLEKLPEKVSNEKRRKLKRYKQEQQRSLSRDRLVFCDINAFITNCNEEQLPNHLIRQCYSLRWQIEIIFKAWKSYFKIDKVKQIKIERFECFLYGCLMLIIVSTNLLRYCRQWYFNKNREEISELKFFKLIASMKQEIKNVILKNKKTISSLLDLIASIVERTCLKENRMGRFKPVQIINLLP